MESYINKIENGEDECRRYEVDECYKRNKKSDPQLIIRFCRKQYKCLMVFMVMLITMFSFFNTIISNIDKDILNDIASGITHSTRETSSQMGMLMQLFNNTLNG